MLDCSFTITRNTRRLRRSFGGKAPSAMTLLEMVIAMAIMVIVFATILPQFRNIQNSWASKEGSAEVLQNARVLTDHLSRNLSKAVRITAVSGPTETNGYVEFEDNDANILRYDIAANNYIEFGPVGTLSDLAGPVSQMQFTCYDANDFDNSTTDVNSIRFLKAETTLTNSAALGRDQTFTTWIYLRANGNNQTGVTKKTPFEYDTSTGNNPALAQIDQTHYLCAYEGPGSDGWAAVLAVDTTDWTISRATPFEYNASLAVTPALCQIDQTHYLCAYEGQGRDGWAVVLTVDTGSWSVSKETDFEYNGSQGQMPALAQIDSTHYLCAYRGQGNDGWAVVLTVDTSSWTISAETAFEYDNSLGTAPALAQIDSTHYLCAYQGPGSDGWTAVLAVDTGTWNISKSSSFEFDTTICSDPALQKIDDSHYLCAYEGPGSDGYTVVLNVDTGSWAISEETPFVFAQPQGNEPALARIEQGRYLCAYNDNSSDGWAVVLPVDTNDWTISAETAYEYDTDRGQDAALHQIEQDNYLCVYRGPGSDGWAVVLNTGAVITP